MTIITWLRRETRLAASLREIKPKFRELYHKDPQMSPKSAPRPDSANVVPMTTNSTSVSQLLQQYGCGPIPFVGTENAFYERHLVFDRAIDPKVASGRERFEAFSRSVRDVLAQRWVLTKTTY